MTDKKCWICGSTTNLVEDIEGYEDEETGKWIEGNDLWSCTNCNDKSEEAYQASERSVAYQETQLSEMEY